MKKTAPAFAMLRWFRHLRSVSGFAKRGLLLGLLALPATRSGLGAAESDSTAGGAMWLPLPVEEIDLPEALDERPEPDLGASFQAGFRDGTLARGRLSAAGEQESRRMELSLFAGPTGEVGAGSSAIEDSDLGVTLTGGRLAARGSGALFEEAVGLARRSASLPTARVRDPSFTAPFGLAAPALDGLAVSRLGRPGSLVRSIWLLGGQALDRRRRLAALGSAVRVGHGSIAAAFGRRGDESKAGLAGTLEMEGGVASTQVLLGSGVEGALLELETAPRPFRFRGRWRYRRADRRPVAGELSAEAGSRAGRIRLRAARTPWGATGSAGRVELEGMLGARGLGALTFRLGRSETEWFSADEAFTTRRERYVVAEATLVRAGDRRMSLLATGRERLEKGVRRAGTSLGGRFEWTRRGRARLELSVEAVRAGNDGPAWSSEIYAGGSTALHSRTRSGVGSSARGSVRLGRWIVGGLVDGREDGTGRRATAATLWIERGLRPAARERSEPNGRSPGG